MTAAESPAAAGWRVERRGLSGWVPCCSWRGEADAAAVLARLEGELPDAEFRMQPAGGVS